MVKDREAWSAAVHGVTKNRTWLSGWKTTRTHYIKCWLAFYSLQSFKDPSAIKCSHHIKLCCKTKEQREIWWYHQFSSVQFSHSVMSDSLGPHESQYTRLPCPSPTRGVYPNSRPSSQWCHPTISYSVLPFSSCFQSFPASGSFHVSQLFASAGQSIGVSASTSVL